MSELYSLFESFVSLPTWLRNCTYVFAALSLAGVGFAFSPMVALIIAIGVLFVIVVLGIYAYVLKDRRSKRQAALGGQLEQNNLATPLAINDPARKARLEDLRKRFQEGLDKFKAVGKDLYKLPWYVVVGEPAAGKSEAIRRCDVGFPPGMQDDFQGVGGTINMNWWFTNYAVILDTAGRLLFEEVAPGTTSEWKEFLRLLRKHRPNCPINGLLLVIPADSLVKGTAKSIDERAGLIARQLDGIQRELDIRFPVYVIISKCDLLNGFREFFEDIDDPDAQKQLLGWSNPDAIDAPFAPERVDEHLQIVVERLRRRRLGLLEDPVAKDPSHRRTDEVDRLYAFPNSISLIAPNLRRYLSTIFVRSEWSAKPLFLRGIYFTSSLREGSELDQELAQAVGVSVDDLPSGRIWERETSFFLRDLFIEKIFRESGLVTRATNTLRMLRQRKLALFGSAALALLAFLLFTWFGYSAMKDSIGHQSGYWLRASEGWTADNNWMPIVTPSEGGYTYKGDQAVGPGTSNGTKDLFDGGSRTLVQFHEALREFTSTKMHISWIFRPLSLLTGNLESERNRAQRIVFEGSIVKPIIEAARSKISGTKIDAATDLKPEADALLSLIKIEAGIFKRHQHLDDKIAPPDAVMASLQSYVVAHDYDPMLADVTTWTYSKRDGAGQWPADWMSGGDTLLKDKAGYNQPIDVGIEHFRESALQMRTASETRWKLIVDLADFLKNQFAPKEQALFQAAGGQGGVQQLDPLLDVPYQDLGKINSDLNDKIQAAKAAGLWKDGPVSLEAAYNQFIKERKSQQSILKTMLDAELAETIADETQLLIAAPLMKEIEDKLNAVEKESQGDLQSLDIAELKKLDAAYLSDYAGHGPVYVYRFGLYTMSHGENQTTAQYEHLVGSGLAPLRKVMEDIAKARQEVATYQGDSKKESGLACAYWLDYAERHQVDVCCAAYLKQAREALTPMLHFPLVWPPEDTVLTVDQLRTAAKLVGTIHQDLNPENLNIQSQSKVPLLALDKQLSLLDPVLSALIAPDGSLAVCTLSMCTIAKSEVEAPVPAGTPDPAGNPGGVAPPPPVPPPSTEDVSYELREGTPTGSEHGNLGGQLRIPLGLVKTFIEKMPVDHVFHFHRYDPQEHEVSCGDNWCALRVLANTTATSESTQGGINWYVKIDGNHPEVFIYFVFQRPFPSITKWPTKQTVLPDH
jgi:hypothetical protein